MLKNLSTTQCFSFRRRLVPIRWRIHYIFLTPTPKGYLSYFFHFMPASASSALLSYVTERHPLKQVVRRSINPSTHDAAAASILLTQTPASWVLHCPLRFTPYHVRNRCKYLGIFIISNSELSVHLEVHCGDSPMPIHYSSVLLVGISYSWGIWLNRT